MNYVLVAHVHADVWFCSPGGTLRGECVAKDALWYKGACVEKDLSQDLWRDRVPKRRVRMHVLAGNLRRLVQEHQTGFDALVADMTWEAEIRRSTIQTRPVDVESARAMYERNPFRWHSDGRVSQIEVAFLWRWEQRGVSQFVRKTVRLDHAVEGEVPWPDGLLTDAALHRRLLNRVERESNQTYCPCRFLGLQTDTGFEPNPAHWPRRGRKSQEKIWFEFSHIRNAATNKLHRVQVRADNLLNRCSRAPGNPLNVTAARSLRFSLDFTDAFANAKEPGMTFGGVMYKNAGRPEIVRQLPNDVDIQREKIWWNRSCGECICMSLLELVKAVEHL